MSEMRELRGGPPWAMEEMILAEPGIVGEILSSEAAREGVARLWGGHPAVTTRGAGGARLDRGRNAGGDHRRRDERAPRDGRRSAARRPCARRVRGGAGPAG